MGTARVIYGEGHDKCPARGDESVADLRLTTDRIKLVNYESQVSTEERHEKTGQRVKRSPTLQSHHHPRIPTLSRGKEKLWT